MKTLQIIFSAFLIFTELNCGENSTTPLSTSSQYKEILSVNMSDITVKLFLNGYDSLTTGYNELFFKVLKSSAEQNQGHVTFDPIMWMSPELWHSAPVSQTFTYDNSAGYYRGYVVFLMPSSPSLYWHSKITYQDQNGTNFVSDSVATYAVYHLEKQWRLFYDSTEQTNYFLTLIKPITPGKGFSDFQVLLHSSDNLAQVYQQVNDASMSIGVFKSDSSIQSSENVSPVGSSDGTYRGRINLPYSGSWKVCDTIFYHGHFITGNPTSVPSMNYQVQ